MIADRRGSATHGNTTKFSQGEVNLRRLSFKRDDVLKIVLPNKTISIHRKDEEDYKKEYEIAAVAMSGSFNSPANHPITILTELGSFRAYASLLDSGVFKNINFTISALAVNGEVIVLKRDFKNSDGGWKITSYGPGIEKKPFIVQHGSGSVKQCILGLFEDEKISLLDVFLYGAHYDERCSMDYSVYSLQENHLYAHVKVSESQAKEAVDRVNKLLAFDRMKTQYYNE
jgi:hypothetical protein